MLLDLHVLVHLNNFCKLLVIMKMNIISKRHAILPKTLLSFFQIQENWKRARI